MTEHAEFAGKVALVTGAASGIGRATARAFAAAGASVMVADTQEAGGAETVALIQAADGEARFVRCDVSDAAQVQAMVDATIDAYGRLDCAFNNAGIEGAQAPTHECTRENWDRTLAINLTGVWLCMQAEIPHLAANGGGAIVNCASVAGLVGFPGLPAYVASKHAVIGLSRTAALEYAAQRIRVNAVCPGIIHTPMIDRLTHDDAEAQASFTAMEPLGRMGEPEEIADAVLWMCSDRASFLTGHPLAVDGGFVAR